MKEGMMIYHLFTNYYADAFKIIFINRLWMRNNWPEARVTFDNVTWISREF